MLFIHQDKYKDKIGIYQIKNTITNTYYIGQTQDRFIERFWNHKWKLTNNIHDNKYLQNSWNKHGEDSFVFSVMHVLQPNEDIDELERSYITQFKDNDIKLYNIQSGGQDITMFGTKMSESTKRKIGEKNRQHMLNKKLSEETKQKMSKVRTGRTLWSKCLLTKEQAIQVKTMLMAGIKPKQVSEELNIDYNIVNNIFSSNTYKEAVVEGWEEFYKNRPNYRTQPNPNKRRIPDETRLKIKELYKQGMTQMEITKVCGVSRCSVAAIIKE